MEPSICPSSEHESLTWDDKDFDPTYIDGKKWRMRCDFPFHYFFNGKHLDGAVPAGFVTNFHSVPRILFPIFHPAEYAQAAVLHDYLYRIQEPRGLCDEIYLAALTKCGAGEKRRKAMYAGVRAFGWVAYRKNKDKGLFDA
jgi:hypothetical protein